MAQPGGTRQADDERQIQRWLKLLRDGTPEQKIEARGALAYVFEHRGMLEEATDLLVSNVNAGVRDADTYRQLARLYRQQGQELLAVQAAGEAAKLLGIGTARIGGDPAPLQGQTPGPAQVKKQSDGLGSLRGWLAAAVIGLIGLGAWSLYELRGQGSPAAPAVQPIATPTRPSEGRISLTVANEYPLSASRETFETLGRAIREIDSATIARIVARGEAQLVPNGTRVRILQTEMNLIRVEVIDGPKRGTVGWLPVNLVGP